MTELLINPYTIKDINNSLLTVEQLEKLPTPRILAYYKKYRYLRWSELRWCCERRCEDISNAKERILSDIANTYMDAIKSLLDSRDHVVR